MLTIFELEGREKCEIQYEEIGETDDVYIHDTFFDSLNSIKELKETIYRDHSILLIYFK